MTTKSKLACQGRLVVVTETLGIKDTKVTSKLSGKRAVVVHY